ncbi:hypothetical protein ABGB12_22415 [Actinocorallia sp. B10E7]|uniref:hypothetical protein n=1 Tax=Actinocorallia sp. B10E7 TaxID=3153558 RepID=UPI00325D8F61
MSDRCGVCLTVHEPGAGHEKPSASGLLLARVIGLCAAGAISCWSIPVSLVWGGMLLSEGFPSTVLAAVILPTGVVAVPVALLYGVLAFTRG